MSFPEGGAHAILVVDPQDSSRARVCALLEQAGYRPRALASGERALQEARRERPAGLILDVDLPGICGYHVLRALRSEYDDGVAIVLVSARKVEPFDRVGGMLLGADDYLSKPVPADELLARLGRLTRRPSAASAHGLTAREREVLELLAAGMRQREIAERLVISEKTVRTHLEHIYSKLGTHDRLQAVVYARRNGLVGTAEPTAALAETIS